MSKLLLQIGFAKCFYWMISKPIRLENVFAYLFERSFCRDEFERILFAFEA